MNWELLKILLLIIPLIIRGNELCENGGIIDPADSKCYHFIPVHEYFDDAKIVCSKFYSIPAIINSDIKNNFIKKYAKEYLSNSEYWIGLTINNDKEWKWDDHRPLEYKNWAQGYPISDSNKACVMAQSNDGKWINVECNYEKRYFVCESFPKIHIGRCLNPAVDVNDKCHNIITVPQTFSDAQQICKSFGTQIASVQTNEHIQKLNKVAQKHLINSDYWMRITNSQIQNAKGSKLTAMASCVAGRITNGQWYASDCSTSKKSFICEQPLARISAKDCPAGNKYGAGPPSEAFCTKPSDPNNLPPSPLEKWFTKEMFYDLFPKANIGWGPSACWPYSYEAFVIAARYFPKFGTSSPNTVYTPEQNYRRDLATFFAHAVQETGENDEYYYALLPTKEEAADCYYRGGLFNWFEGGPNCYYLDTFGLKPEDGAGKCVGGNYCSETAELNYWFPCRKDDYGCYFGRGTIQISYNFNYGLFGQWLATKNVTVDLLKEPNLVMTKLDPPISIMASLWFFMTPQPPKPAMHDIVMGQWYGGDANKAAGYTGPIFGPTSLVINNECGGEDANEPGGDGENRRIKAFRWFCKYFGVPTGEDKFLTCKGMPNKLTDLKYDMSYEPDWSTTWEEKPCDCKPAPYEGVLMYYDPKYYSEEFVAMNKAAYERCLFSIYDNPSMYGMTPESARCLNYPRK